MQRNQRGFTLVELLVAVGIIGVLASITAVSVGSARGKARDARRIADVKSVQNSLELYFNNLEKYPTTAAEVTIARDYSICSVSTALVNATTCTAAQGAAILAPMPGAPTPPTTNAYKYNSADGSTYTIKFTLENITNGLSAAEHTATPTGIQ